MKGENVGGMTPQHVTGSAEGITIRFRPRKRIQGAEIRVTSAGELVKRARRMIVVPSEMQTIELSADDMAKVTGPIEVSCTPVANGKKGA